MATIADRVAAQAGVERQANYERLTKAQRAKLGIEWVEPIHMADLEAGELVKLEHHEDLATLGTWQRHCSGTHYVWVCQEKIWHFFTVLDETAQPLITLHTKDVEWLGKMHPRNKAKPPGRVPASAGGYSTYNDLLAYCKMPEVKIDPEANDYAPPTYHNVTYDQCMHSLKWGVVEKPKGEDEFPSFEEWCKTQKEWNRTRALYDFAKQGGPFITNDYLFRPALIAGKRMAAMSCNGGYAENAKAKSVREQIKAWWLEHLDEDGEPFDAKKAKAGYY